ncbi:hypothetical protein C0989_004626 [Termitomyces sp. Mn162]|nr:hypothetical protein C0989_004626 [Termitomyces sp. Mn162]
MQDACDAFHDTVFAVEEGVQGFYDALLNHAQNMAMFPNKFTICEWFLEGIPSDMLIALIHNGGLAPKVNTVKEFVSEAKAYESSIKTAAHYLEHSKKSQAGWQLLLAAAQSPAIGTALAKWTEAARKHLAVGKDVVAITSGQPSKDARQSANCYKCGKAGHFAYKCREPAKPAPRVFVQAAHTAAQSDVGEANHGQEEEPAEAEADEVVESDGTQEHGEEYVDLEMYDNEYYTCGSDSEGLSTLCQHKTKNVLSLGWR